MVIGGLHDLDGGALRVRAQRTVTAWERTRGLLARPAPAPGTGLIISPCSSVHMFGMRYAIDVVYLDCDWTIVSIVSGLKPWRASWGRGAAHVLETAAGEARRLGLMPGLRLQWVASGSGPAMDSVPA